MKVMMVNGSPHPQGNTAMALQEMKKVFEENGVEVELVHVGNKAIRGCIGCRACAQKGKCVFDDIVNETAPLFAECDGLVVGSSVYYASANATLVAYLTRLFFSTGFIYKKRTIAVWFFFCERLLGHRLYPVASALAYHSWAFCMFFSTPSPFSYICPKAAMAGAAIMSPRWAAFLYKVNALL